MQESGRDHAGEVFRPLPSGFELWNRALRGAFIKGAEAHMGGLPVDACPYRDKRTDSGRLSWSRSFIRAWQDGWRYAQENWHSP